MVMFYFFFFQAEDGIRDIGVTGVQTCALPISFEPQLVEGKAIQIHPLVCTAFNADFDGDQMAVHLPLSAEAQAEARILMLSSNNILSPADGRPITAPTQDMVLGLYHLTTLVASPAEADGGQPRSYSSTAEAIMAYDKGSLGLQERAWIRLDEVFGVDNGSVNEPWEQPEDWEPGAPARVLTSLGRVLFNEALPEDYRFVNYQVPKKELGAIVNDLAERYPKVQVAATLDALKSAGFHWATRAGITIAIDDVVTPPAKQEILDRHEAEARQIERQYERGVITDAERRGELIEIWTRARAEVSQAMVDNFPTTNPVWVMVNSGARGNMMRSEEHTSEL